jgi:putative ATPase
MDARLPSLDLFSSRLEENLSRNAPLAARMRPRNLSEVVGQEALLGPRGTLRRSLEAGAIGSMIFFGPPGSGKTTVAKLVADHVQAAFVELSAVDSGVADVRRVLDQARRRLGEDNKRTVLFIDEIHRFSKAQQDSLLHAIEDGLVVLIGATTENPYFEVIPALLSRSELYTFSALPAADVRTLVDRALSDPGVMSGRSVTVGEEERDLIASAGLGDARRSLNLLERAVRSARQKGLATLDLETLEEEAQHKLIVYGKLGDAHYDHASAFIKSLRGSDPDAAIYYLAVMLTAGEDPKFIARRLVIFASEDVGNADPRALEVAVAASRAVEFVGLPECRINLAQAVTYLSCAPKSNASYVAIAEAMNEVERDGAVPPPLFLRDANYRGAKELGHGEGYVYPHEVGGYTSQSYLPEALRDREFYRPTGHGLEARIADFLARLRAGRKGSTPLEHQGDPAAGSEEAGSR